MYNKKNKQHPICVILIIILKENVSKDLIFVDSKKKEDQSLNKNLNGNNNNLIIHFLIIIRYN